MNIGQTDYPKAPIKKGAVKLLLMKWHLSKIGEALLVIASKTSRLKSFNLLSLYRVPLSSCSLSMASKSALKFPFPNDFAPFR